MQVQIPYNNDNKWYGIKCARCKLWITKIRKTFYKPSKAKPNNKKYDRKKNKIKKEDL